MTARAAARGRRAHQRWSLLGWPCRMLFSRALAALIWSSGNATSISFVGMSLVSELGSSDALLGGNGCRGRLLDRHCNEILDDERHAGDGEVGLVHAPKRLPEVAYPSFAAIDLHERQ